MAYLDPGEAFDNFRDRTLEAIEKQFPVDGRLQTLRLERLEVQDDKSPFDLRAQHTAKISGDTWGVPVYAHLVLTDKATGKETKARTRVAELPKMTRRYSQIVNGQEYQVDNQWQLKPGAYVRRRATGQIETQFQSAKHSFDVTFDDETKAFRLDYRSAKLPLYPILKALGADDASLEKAWGKQIFDANKSLRKADSAVDQFYRTSKRGAAPSSAAEANKHLVDTFKQMSLRPDVTELTLGKPIDHVNSDALTRASAKMLKVQAGAPPDDRDSLVFKDLRSVGDFAYDKIMAAGPTIKSKILRKLNTAANPRDVIRFEVFDKPIRETFFKNAASQVAKQVNPVEMVSTAQQTTVMGPGGIQSEQQIMDEVKFVNPTHMAFLDPIHTPEGCFDAETEVLTHRGWLPWPQVTGEEQLACLVNGRLEFEYPLALVAAPFDGELLGMDTTRVKQRGSKPLKYLITPNHRVWSRPVDGAGYRIDRADEMHGKMRVFQTGHAPYLGTETSWYQLPRVAGNNSSKNVAAVEIGDWAEFMGWFLSEGHVAYNEETSSYHVKLFQSDVAGKDGCARIEALLEGMPFTWSRRERENKRMVYSISTKQLAHYMSQFGGSYDKFIPEEAFEWPLIARQRLLWSLMRGDGRLTQTRGGKVMANEVYTTTSEQLALGVERLIISLGMTAKVRQYEDSREERYKDMYEIRVFQNPERHVQKSHLAAYYTQKYNGMVYCAEVPGGLVYVRRAGSIGFWSGNSRTGVTLRMPISVRKVGNEPQVPLFNVRANKMEYVGPKIFMQSKIALPDQVTWENGKPTPNSDTVKVSGAGNDVEEAKFKDVDYVMRHSSQFFNITSNLIPFIGNTSGGRASMATRHMEQAISLKHREAPLVQVGTGGNKEGTRTFEEIVGTQASHQAMHSGVVKAIKSDAIVITDKNGHDHESQIYRNYPLNDAKSVLDSTALVNVGDHVHEGQTIADTNYSKNGTIALGTNLRVGYIPYKGYNFEDGIVISASAADKLASVHLHKHNVSVDDDTVLHKKRYISQHPALYNRAQLATVDDNGIVKVGTKVAPGDPLVLSMKKTNVQDRVGLSALRKSLGEQYADRSLTWSGEAAGEVVGAFRKGDEVIVHVKSLEPMQVGDKLAGRYGNKGIVTKIVADKEMPHTPDGDPIEVALNPSGVPGRMNIGQVLETAASKIAKKTGKTYIVQNFNGGNQLEKVQAELKKHGISDTEELFDPTTQQKLGVALVGYQHMVKLHHQVDKKVSVRSGMNLPGHDAEKYDSNLQPAGGGHSGGQSMDPLGLYSLLAHGARANIREMQTWKSEGPDPQTSPQKQWQSQHHDVWDAIQHGDPLPLPKPTFAFRKFTDMLAGAGINMEKKGHQFILSPLTDSQIEHMTGDRVLPKPAEMLYAKVDPKTGDPKPKPGGLFDDKLTGGHGGKKWSRMTLAEPVPNPVFEDSIRIVSGLSKEDYADIVNGEKAVNKQGHLAELGHGVTGGAGIKLILDTVHVDTALAAAKQELKTVSSSKVDKVLKKVKRLQALQKAELTPSQAYVLHSLPIIPPALRPVSVMQDGNFNFADINQLYSQFAQNNDQLNDPTLKEHLTDHDKKELRKNLYDGMKAIMGVGIPYKDAEHKGLIHQISGDTPKTGFFQSTLISRKQDMSMRSTIVPEPSLALDEVGLPKEHALKLFAPFVVHQLKQSGAAENVAEAQKMVAKGTPAAFRALNRVMEERPVMLKRDPSLHKYSVQAFRPKVVEGNAIKIHPLVTGGYNADFDGDSIDLDTPILLRIQGVMTHKTGRELVDLLDAEDGDYVVETKHIEAYTYDGWRPVRNVSFHEVANKRKFRVTLKNGFSFIASEDHSLMVGRAQVKPTQLVVGTVLDHVASVDHHVRGGRDKWSYDKGVAYGNFLGDGCAELRRQGGGRVSIACLPQEERDYLMNIWRTEFPNANPSQYIYGFHVNGVELARHFLAVCGRYCEGKYIGGDLFSRGTDFLKGMLAGYILADGSVETTRSGSFLVRTWSRSKKLRDGMSVVATMLGLPHSVRERTAKGKVNYIISFGKEAIKLIDFRCAGKKGKLIRFAREEYETNRNDERRSQSERGYEVLSIEEVEYSERMIDLEVDDEQHVFTLLGGVVVHNTMSVFVPISADAVKEAQKMFPSNNLFSEASGRVMYQPTLESALGLYKLTRTTDKKAHVVAHPADAIQAVKSGKITVNDPVKIGSMTTTAGRILLSAALPEAMQKNVLENFSFKFDKKGLDKVLTEVAHNHKADFGAVADKLKDIGNGASSGVVTVEHSQYVGANRLEPGMAIHVPVGVHTLGLDDFTPDVKTREHVLGPARKEAAKVKANKGLDTKESERQLVNIWSAADRQIKEDHLKKVTDAPNNLLTMHLAGVKPGWGQYKQMTLAPMLVEDAAGRVIPTPITNSYSEGLDTGEYWTQMHGARRGSVLKVQQVRDPGYLSKLLMANTMDMLVTGHDCGTTRGISMPVTDRDVVDRYLQKDFTAKGMSVPAGTMLTSTLVSKMRAADKTAQLIVRSPLKCEHAKGLCQKCVGISAEGHHHDLGDNVGVTSAQALGERAVQLTLRVFHTGGTVDTSGGSKVLGGFERFNQLMTLPKVIQDSATLAMRSGTVEKVEKDATGVNVWVGGKKHHVGKDAGGNPLWQPLHASVATSWVPPTKGSKVEKGQQLSDPTRTLVNPHDLYKATDSIESVQNYLADEVYGLYKDEGIKRQHVETVVKAMSNLTKIDEPGDYEGVLRGEFHPTSVIHAVNRQLVKDKKTPILHTPVLKGVDMMPLSLREDWMAKLQHQRLGQTILEAAATLGKSDVHGLHPVPGMAFGSEFGMTRKHVNARPSLMHLQDVEEHEY